MKLGMRELLAAADATPGDLAVVRVVIDGLLEAGKLDAASRVLTDPAIPLPRMRKERDSRRSRNGFGSRPHAVDNARNGRPRGTGRKPNSPGMAAAWSSRSCESERNPRVKVTGRSGATSCCSRDRTCPGSAFERPIDKSGSARHESKRSRHGC